MDLLRVEELIQNRSLVRQAVGSYEQYQTGQVAQSDWQNTSGLSEVETRVLDVATENNHRWNFFVGSAGFLQEQGKIGQQFSIGEVVHILNTEIQGASNYFETICNYSFDEILTAGRDLATAMGGTRKLDIVALTSRVSFCREKCGDNAECLAECMNQP